MRQKNVNRNSIIFFQCVKSEQHNVEHNLISGNYLLV